KEPYKPSHPAPAAEAAEPVAEPVAEPASPLSAADEVIRTARARGYKDADIPTELRFPMLGLETDAPGDAARRLTKAVEQFRWQLAEDSSAAEQ
ncbi:MAG: hypothetical protein L0K27_12145, partial [Corynebacterium nuruki]|nr:hypothetical protein [Corynebacterium nuruki]